MISWLTENIGTIVVLAVLILIVGGIIRSMIKTKKQGGSSCGCGCSGCDGCSSCGATSEK